LDLVEEMGRTKPRTISELMEIANRFADREDAYHNKRAWSPERDRPNRYNNLKCRSCNDDVHNPCNQVAAWYKRSSEEGGERWNSGYHSRDDSGGDRSRNFDPSPEDILNGPCHIHYTYLDGKRVFNHLMRDCRTFMKLQEAIEFSQAKNLGSTTYGAPPPPPYNKGATNQGYPRQSNQGYPQSKVHITAMIQPVPKSKKEQKNISRQVNLAISLMPATTEYLH
jgi:hypothetical protein